MKRLKAFIILPLLLLAVAVGLFLPSAAAWLQDTQTLEKSELLQAPQVNVYYETSLTTLEKLTLQRENAFPFTQPLEGGLALTKNQAVALAQSFVGRLALSEQTYTESTAQAYMFFYENAKSFLQWRVHLIMDTGWEGDLLVDDATGLVLSANMYVTVYDGSMPSAFLNWQAGDAYEEDFLRIHNVIADTLGVESLSVLESSSYGSGVWELVNLTDGEEEASVNLNVSTDCLSFNYS